MVGDSTWDCEAAERAGIETIAVLTGGFSEQELRDAGAVQVFHSIDDAARVARADAARAVAVTIQAVADRLGTYRKQARLRDDARAQGARRARRRRRRASSYRSTTPAACTGTCVWSTTARSPPGRCRAASRRTRTRTGSRCSTEDHPLEYLEFEGDIPKGEYGAGTMRVWDRGTYEAEKFRDDEVIATFHGERMRGRYALFRTRGKDWLIHRMDPPEDPGYEPMPDRLEPMLARSGKLPRDEQDYGFEVKWDGIRTLLFSDHGHIDAAGPQLLRLHPALPGGARARPRAGGPPADPRRRGRGLRRAGPAELRAAPVAHAPRL